MGGLEADRVGGHAARDWRYHVSVDDIFGSLFEAPQRWDDASDDGVVAYLTGLHHSFGCCVDLYVFERGVLEGRERRLSELEDSVNRALRSRAWLRIGPHAECDELAPFGQPVSEQQSMLRGLYEQIDRLVGREARSRWTRLHYFSECYEVAPYLISQGVESLLLTDRDAVAYRLGKAAKERLQRDGLTQHAGLELRRSYCRIEELLTRRWDDEQLETAFRERLSEHGYVALFTHEVELKRAEVRDELTRCVGVLDGLGAQTI